MDQIDLVDQIKDRLEAVNERIYRSAAVSGRQPEQIRLVVVSKAQPALVLEAAIQAGVKILGENYPEEAATKIEKISTPAGFQWHMIGHVQSRKVRLIAGRFDLLHSLDSLHLAQKLDRTLAESSLTMPVLLEFNVGEEESKYGWMAGNESKWENLLPEIAAILALPNLSVRGLMTMPPFFEDAELTRPYFARLKNLQRYLQAQLPQGSWDELSMGTSTDFEAAIVEGATLVRIGQAVLGPRPARI